MSEGTSVKPRDRVSMSLNHQKPDRCPMQISFTPEFAQRLREDMNLTNRSVHNPHGGGNTYELERALGQDILITSVSWANSYYANESYAGGMDTYTDEWGVEWKNFPIRPVSAPDSIRISSVIRWPTMIASNSSAPPTRTVRSCIATPSV